MTRVSQDRRKHTTLKKAKAHADKMLPVEPKSLVEKYLEKKERPSKEEVVAGRKSRFSKPALPADKESGSAIKKPCFCKGKCATKKCECRGSECKCNVDKCKNCE